MEIIIKGKTYHVRKPTGIHSLKTATEMAKYQPIFVKFQNGGDITDAETEQLYAYLSKYLLTYCEELNTQEDVDGLEFIDIMTLWQGDGEKKM